MEFGFGVEEIVAWKLEVMECNNTRQGQPQTWGKSYGDCGFLCSVCSVYQTAFRHDVVPSAEVWQKQVRDSRVETHRSSEVDNIRC